MAKRIITVKNITELNNKDLKKIKQFCFRIANRHEKIQYNDRDFQLFLDNRYGKNKLYAKFTHWDFQSGKGIKFVLECTNILDPEDSINILEKINWKFRDSECSDCPQTNSIINTLESPYHFYDIKIIKVGDTSSEIKSRVNK